MRKALWQFSGLALILVTLGCGAFQPFTKTSAGGEGASQNGNTSSSSVKEELTPDEEYDIGRAVAATIIDRYKTLNNPGLTAYLNKICAALTVHSEKPDIFNGYHVMILDSDEINAFATTGGHIFVTRGLLSAAQSEDALASVIGHEVAHIQLRHSAKLIENVRFFQKMQDTLGRATESLGIAQDTQQFTAAINELVDTMLTKGYSSVQEFAADSFSISLLAGAGYTPSAMIDVLDVLRSRQTDQSRMSGFGKNHPSPQLRIDHVKTTIANYTVEDTRSFRVQRYQAAVQ